MKKAFGLIILVILLVSLVPLVGAEARISPKLRVCVDYLNKNTDVRNTKLKCESLESGEVDCDTFLKSEGVENSTEKCDKFFRVGSKIIKERQYIGDEVTEQVSEWKLKKIDRYMVRREEQAGEVKEFISGLSENDSIKFFALNRAQQKKLLEMSAGDAYEWLAQREVRAVSKPSFKKREVSEERRETSQTRLGVARSAFRRARNSYVDGKSQFADIKDRLDNCDGSICDSLRTEILVKAEEYVNHMIDMKINYLTKVRERVSSAEVLGEDEAQIIIIELDDALDSLDEYKTDLRSVESKDDLKNMISDIKGIWNDIRFRGYYYSILLYVNKVENIIERSLYLERKIDGALGRLEEEGVDIESMDGQIELFSQEVESARGKMAEAKTKINDISGLTGQSLKDESHTARLLILESRDHMKEVARIVKEVLKDVRKYGGELEDEEDTVDGEIFEVVEVE